MPSNENISTSPKPKDSRGFENTARVLNHVPAGFCEHRGCFSSAPYRECTVTWMLEGAFMPNPVAERGEGQGGAGGERGA